MLEATVLQLPLQLSPLLPLLSLLPLLPLLPLPLRLLPPLSLSLASR
ncbi:hypothetical protein [Leucobacter chinensis]|nr:hypothetical protein [Leucobacter chinensis]